MSSADPLALPGAILFHLFTIFYYSFYWKYNPFFQFAEASFIAASMGVGLALSTQVVWNQSLSGLGADPLLIIPFLIGLLFLTRFSGRYFWVSRYPTAIMLGTGFGITLVRYIGSNIIPNVRTQMSLSFTTPILDQNISNFISVAMYLLVSYYFLWTARSRSGSLEGVKYWIIRAARIAIMLAYGSNLGLNGMIPMANLVYERVWGILQFIGVAA